MTRRNDGSAYFIYLAAENESEMPREIRINSHRPSEGARVTILGSSVAVPWKPDGTGFVVTIPDRLRTSVPCLYAWTIKVSSLK